MGVKDFLASAPGIAVTYYESAVPGYSHIYGSCTTIADPAYGVLLPIVTVAGLYTKPGLGNVTEYLLAASEAMKTIEATEPRMWHHTFEKDPVDGTKFYWVSFLENEGLLAHFYNPALGAYMAAHGAYGVGGFDLNLYGTASADLKTFIASAGISTTYYESLSGYSKIAEMPTCRVPPPSAPPGSSSLVCCSVSGRRSLLF